jgi:tetratricopeptide (TPR) repeat protein/transcriptional regulator with XRE-family HTH domain
MGEGDSQFGVQLRACRRSAGISQEELAERSGLHVRTIRNLERGRSRWPYQDTLRRLADALDLPDAVRADFIAGTGRRLGSGRDEIDADLAEAGLAGHCVQRDTCIPAPRQLPAGLRHFTGRTAELDFLTAALGESGSPGRGTVVISAIGGMAGVGKTALAVQWAHEHAAEFPDGQLYADLRGFGPAEDRVDVAAVARRFLDALQVPPARIPSDTDAQFGLYRSTLAGKRILIILDNVGDASDVRPLLPGTAGSAVLVTSRSKLTDLVALDGAVPLAVGLLDPEEARDLLARRLGEDRVAREQPEAYVLHDLLRAYAAEQADAQDSAGERRAAIRRVLDHYLLTAHQATLMCLATGRPPTPPEASAGVTGVPLADLEQAKAWSHAEQAVLFAVISLAASNGFTTHAWQLAWSVEVFPDQWRRWQEQVATGQIVLAAAERAGDQAGQGYIHRHLGRALSTGGRYAEARGHLQRAAALVGGSGDQTVLADVELALAATLIELGDPAQGLACLQRALTAYQAAGQHVGAARALNDIGWCYLLLGNYEQGLASCEKALALIGSANEPFARYIEAAALDSIGYAHHHLGRHGDAIANYLEVLGIYQSYGEIRLQAVIFDHLGDAYLAAADPAAARDAWKKAVAIFDDLRHPSAGPVRAKLRTLLNGAQELYRSESR